MSYCEPQDLYSYGLVRGALPNPGRPAASVDASANTIELDVHGFATDDSVTFRADSGGTLPSPLVAGTEYFAIPVSESRFSVASSLGGAAIDLTTAGSNLIVIAPLPIASAIAWAERIIDDMLPAHVVPLVSPYPPIISMTCAELAAGKLLMLTGGASRSLGEITDFARKRLDRWSKGIPIRGTNAPSAANLAQSASAPYRDSRGWSRYGGL